MRKALLWRIYLLVNWSNTLNVKWDKKVDSIPQMSILLCEILEISMKPGQELQR